jgi:hypothetical protein
MTVTDVAAAAYDESKHTRGTGDKGGEFVSQSMGEHSGSRPGDQPFAPAAAPGAKAKPGQQPGRPVQQGPLPGTMWRGGRNNPAAVKRLQKLLKDLGLGADLEADGVYGPKTEAAIKEVQRRLKMKQTGVASPALVQRLKIAKALSPCVGGGKVKASAPDPEFDLEDTVDWEPGEGDELLDDEDDEHPITAAAGHDVTPGHDELHHWWVYGEGRGRWKTWTELRDQLVEHVGPVKAAVYASAWFHERYGYWSGSDLNRVKNGKPPRGKVIGPG